MALPPEPARVLSLTLSQPHDVLTTIPVLEPPAGETSDFVNPPSFVPSLVAATFLSTLPMLFVVGMRLYSQVRVRRPRGWDDYACFLAAGMSIVVSAMSIYAGTGWYGKHGWDVSVSLVNIPDFQKIGYFFMVANFLTIMVVKLSLFLLYIRLFDVSKYLRIMSWIGIVACVIFYPNFSTFSLTSCLPLPGETIFASLLGDRCNNARGHGLFAVGFNIATDVYLFLIPVLAVSRLQLTKAKRLRLFGVFGFAALAFLSCILSCYFKVKLGGVKDVTFWLGASLVADVVEINLGIIVSCFPVIQPALAPLSVSTKRLLSTTVSSFSASKSQDTFTATSTLNVPKGGKTFFDTAVTVDDPKYNDPVVTETELIYMRPVSPSSPLTSPNMKELPPHPAKRRPSWLQRNVFRPGSDQSLHTPIDATPRPGSGYFASQQTSMQRPGAVHSMQAMHREDSVELEANSISDPWQNRNVV